MEGDGNMPVDEQDSEQVITQDDDSGFFEKMEKVAEEDKTTKNIDKDELEELVFSLFKKKWSDAKIINAMEMYRVNGKIITKVDIINLRDRYIDIHEKGIENEPPPMPHLEIPSEDRISDIDKRFEIYNKLKNEDPVLAKKILAQGYNVEVQSGPTLPTPSKVQEMREFMELMMMMDELRGKGKDEKDGKQEIMETIAFLKEMGVIPDKGGHMGFMGNTPLSPDPQVAMAQIVTPAVLDGMKDIDGTIREAWGLKAKDKKNMTEAQEKKAKEVLDKLQGVTEKYGLCPKCSTKEDPTFVPKGAPYCWKCGTPFKSPEQIIDERKKAGFKEPTQQQQPPPQQQRPRRERPTSPTEEFPASDGPKPWKNGKNEPEPEDDMEGTDDMPNEEDEEMMKFQKVMYDWLNEDDGYLVRLMRKIEHDHDPYKTGAGMWHLSDPDDRKRLLYIRKKGVGWVADFVKPWVTEFGEHTENLYEFYTKTNTKKWLSKMMTQIGREAKDEKIDISDEEVAQLDKEIERFVEEKIKGSAEEEIPTGPSRPPTTGYNPETHAECPNCHGVFTKEEYMTHVEQCGADRK